MWAETKEMFCRWQNKIKTPRSCVQRRGKKRTHPSQTTILNCMETKTFCHGAKWKNSREMKDSQHFPHFNVLKSSQTIQESASWDSLSLHSYLNLRRPWTSPGTVKRGERNRPCQKLGNEKGLQSPSQRNHSSNESDPAYIESVAVHSHTKSLWREAFPMGETGPQNWEVPPKTLVIDVPP